MFNISIQGCVINGGSIICENGRDVSTNMACTTKFDERKSVDGSTIERITVISSVADISVSPSESSTIEAYFYGQADISSDIKFDVSVVGHELKIMLDLTGNCYNGCLNLDITVPKKCFEAITATSLSANINLGEGISAKSLKVNTESGSFKSQMAFANASVSTKSGDVELHVDAKNDIVVDISAMSGDVWAEFSHIDFIDLSTRSMSGSIRNRHRSEHGYTATVDISTMSGDIEIR